MSLVIVGTCLIGRLRALDSVSLSAFLPVPTRHTQENLATSNSQIAPSALRYGPVSAPAPSAAASSRAVAGRQTRRVEAGDSDSDDGASSNATDAALLAGATGASSAAHGAAPRQQLPLGDLEDRMVAAPNVFADPVMIAKHELVRKVLPFVIRRVLPGGARVEDIPLEELQVNAVMLDMGEWL